MREKSVCTEIGRNSSIELLRIIASIGVILLHYNSIAHTYIENNMFIQYYLCCLDVLVDCAVNIFIIISGFFLYNVKRRGIKKIIGIITQFVLFRSAMYFLLAIINGTQFSFWEIINLFLPINYYIVLYSVLYLLSPYLNILLQNLSNRESGKFVFLLFLLFSVETWVVDILECTTEVSYMGLSSIGLHGSQSGFTIINFILCYCIGAYVGLNNEKIQKIKLNKIIAYIFIVWLILSLMHILKYVYQINLAVLNYNNPLIIVLSVLLFITFNSVRINSIFINKVAKASFTCFIIHSSFLPYLGIERAVNSSMLYLVVHQLVVAIALYMLSYIVFVLYENIFLLLIRKGIQMIKRVKDI